MNVLNMFGGGLLFRKSKIRTLTVVTVVLINK